MFKEALLSCFPSLSHSLTHPKAEAIISAHICIPIIHVLHFRNEESGSGKSVWEIAMSAKRQKEKRGMRGSQMKEWQRENVTSEVVRRGREA